MTQPIFSRYVRDRVWKPTLATLTKLADGQRITRMQEESDVDGAQRVLKLWLTDPANPEGDQLVIRLQITMTREKRA